MIRKSKIFVTVFAIITMVFLGSSLLSPVAAGNSKKCEKSKQKLARFIKKRVQMGKAIAATEDKIQKEPNVAKWRTYIEKLMDKQDAIDASVRKTLGKLEKYCD